MLSSINPLSLNDYGYTGLGVKVAVVDTGIDSSKSNLTAGLFIEIFQPAQQVMETMKTATAHMLPRCLFDRDAAGMHRMFATIYAISNGDGNLDASTDRVFNQHVTDNIDVSNNSWAPEALLIPTPQTPFW